MTKMRGSVLSVMAVIAGLMIPDGCEPASSGPQTGSESHFLRACSSDADCGELSCLCGVCSAPCGEGTTCEALAGSAECVDNSARPEQAQCPVPPEALCDVPCEANRDCASLGSEFICQSGFCRVGATANDDTTQVASGSAIVEDGLIEVDELCAMYQESVCRKEQACEGDPEYCSEEHCRAALSCQGIAALEESIASGRIAYDEAAAAACYQSILEAPCDFSYQLIVIDMPDPTTLLSACPGVLEAQAQEGDTCLLPEDCALGTHCDDDLSCPGTCVLDDPPLGEEGDPCPTVIGGEQRCVPPLVCTLEVDPDSGERLCGVAPSVGDPCSSANDCRCSGPEELCGVLGCDASLGECVPLSQVGEPCSMLDAAGIPDCMPPAWCDGGFQAGICQPLSAEGGPCLSYSGCEAPLVCPDGTCVPPAAPGETCSSSVDCIRGDCVDGSCALLGASGDACENKYDCSLGLMCSGGVCLPLACPSAPCSADHPCLEGRCVDGQCLPAASLGEACDLDADCARISDTGGVICQSGICTDTTPCG